MAHLLRQRLLWSILKRISHEKGGFFKCWEACSLIDPWAQKGEVIHLL